MYRSNLRPGCVSGDPRKLICKFGKCCKCSKPMKGQFGYYWPKMPKGKQIYCEDCGYQDYQNFLSAAWDETGFPY
jgi:hypothetical protein